MIIDKSFSNAFFFLLKSCSKRDQKDKDLISHEVNIKKHFVWTWAALGAAQGVQMNPLSWAQKKNCI